MKQNLSFDLNCPIPFEKNEKILLAHGGGGKMTQRLINDLFVKTFNNTYLAEGHDGALLNFGTNKLAFTTDSYVIQPIFFKGGNIGELAVNGTVNDLVCCGAIPRFISLAFILEEGLLFNHLSEIVFSIKKAADYAGVQIVTGDTKVVEKGKGDQIFINTSGIGEVVEGLLISPRYCHEGDVIIINGTIADHGIAIMSERAGMEFETEIKSDTAALNRMMQEVFETTTNIGVMRDPTRGGLASTLNEIAQSSNTGVLLFEDKIPINPQVFAACEMLGFDPLYVANEGKILIIAPATEADTILSIMRTHPEGRAACVIGKITDDYKKTVRLRTKIGSHRMIDMISGEQLPRIC